MPRTTREARRFGRHDRDRTAPPETVALWVKLVATMSADELDDFERRTFAAWDRASLGDLRGAVQRGRRDRSRASPAFSLCANIERCRTSDDGATSNVDVERSRS